VIDGVLSAARLLQFAASLMLFGSALFCLYGRKVEASAVPGQQWAWTRPFLLIGSALGLVATIAWLMPEAKSLTGTWISWSDVLTQTRFGRVAALRAVLLAVLFAASALGRPAKRLWLIAALMGGTVVASFAWSGHGSMGGDSAAFVHRGADALHLLAAGVWLGALPALGILVVRALRTQRPTEVRLIAHGLMRFSAIGPVVVAIVILTGLINSWFLIGVQQWRALFHTPYGLVLLVKLALFLSMLVLAAAHRFWLTPQLQTQLSGTTSESGILRKLRVSLIAETVLALMVLAAVAVLGLLEPPASR